MGAGNSTRRCHGSVARFKITFERHAIDVPREADITGSTSLLRFSWDEASTLNGDPGSHRGDSLSGTLPGTLWVEGVRQGDRDETP
jgi:hypothetical protein